MKHRDYADMFRDLAQRGEGLAERYKELIGDVRDLASRLEGSRNLCESCGLHAKENCPSDKVRELEKQVEQLKEERDHYQEELGKTQKG